MGHALCIVLPACLWLGLVLGCERKGDQIKIGGVLPLTGDGATFGVSTRRGFELAVEEWNAKGGVLGKPVRLIVADDKGDPAEGVTAVTMLISQRKVVGVLGPAMSKVSLAGAPVAQSAGIPLIAPASTNIKVTQVGDFIFRACFVDPFQGNVGAGFAYHDLKARKAACIFDLGNDYASHACTAHLRQRTLAFFAERNRDPRPFKWSFRGFQLQTGEPKRKPGRKPYAPPPCSRRSRDPESLARGPGP